MERSLFCLLYRKTSIVGAVAGVPEFCVWMSDSCNFIFSIVVGKPVESCGKNKAVNLSIENDLLLSLFNPTCRNYVKLLMECLKNS